MGQCGASLRARMSRSKKSVRAAEQERPDVAEARLRWASQAGPPRRRPRSLGTLEDSDVCGRAATGWVHRALCHRLRDERGDLHRISTAMLGTVSAVRRY